MARDYTGVMPPSQLRTPETHPDHLLPAGHKSGTGPIIGVIVIVVMLVLGGLYFWGAQLNRESEQLPFIPGDATAN